MKRMQALGCCVGNGNLDPQYVEDFVLPSPDQTKLLKPFTLDATFQESAQTLYGALWERRNLAWDFTYLAPSLAELETMYVELPKYLRVEWIVQILVLIKERKEDTHFRKILFLILGMFLDTKMWPSRDVNFLYTEFLRRRITEADHEIGRFTSGVALNLETATVYSTRSSIKSYVTMDSTQVLLNHSKANPVRIPSIKEEPELVQEENERRFEDISWAYELKHICEYKLRDFVTKDETKILEAQVRGKGFLRRFVARFKSARKNRDSNAIRRAKPVLLEVHNEDGTVTYRKKDVETSYGFKESIIAVFCLGDIPEKAELYEVFCDARKTVQKVPFSTEDDLLDQCGEMNHFHYYVYKPHTVDFLNNLGEKVVIEESKTVSGPTSSKTPKRKVGRACLVSDDMVATYAAKYQGMNLYADTEPSMFDPIEENTHKSTPNKKGMNVRVRSKFSDCMSGGQPYTKMVSDKPRISTATAPTLGSSTPKKNRGTLNSWPEANNNEENWDQKDDKNNVFPRKSRDVFPRRY